MPNRMYIAHPVWLLMSIFTAYDASTHVYILFRFIAPNALFSLKVQWENLSILLTFYQSSTSIFDTLVVKKSTANYKWGLYLSIINKKFATTEWNSSPFFHLISRHLPLLQTNYWLMGMRLKYWHILQTFLCTPTTVQPYQLVLCCILSQCSSIKNMC